MKKKMWESSLSSWLLSGLLIASVLCAVTVGTVDVSLAEAFGSIVYGITGWESFASYGDSAVYDIIWMLRLPRIVLAVLTGMGLSVCGVIMQAIVKNPLADPYILGISSGASLGANFVGLAAAGGAFAVSMGVLVLSGVGGHSSPVKLLLSGMALSAVCSAFSSFIVYFANNREGMQTIAYWLMGSLANAKWENLAVICPIIVLGTAFFWTQSQILNLMLVGDATAITLGRDLTRYRHGYLVLSSLMVGFVVYSAGMIGFVGLICPHVMRMLTGAEHRRLLPASAFAGAILLVWADVLCRTILPRTELPIGILVSLVGAPCFVYLMVRRSYGFGDAE